MPYVGVGVGWGVEEGFAFVEEGRRATEVISWFQGGAEISNALLGWGIFKSFSELNGGPSSDRGGPSACDEDVCCIGTVEGFGITICVEW